MRISESTFNIQRLHKSSIDYHFWLTKELQISLLYCISINYLILVAIAFKSCLYWISHRISMNYSVPHTLRRRLTVSELFLEHLKLLVNLCQWESHTIRVTGSQGMSLRLKHRWRGHLRTVEGGGERNGAGQRYSRGAWWEDTWRKSYRYFIVWNFCWSIEQQTKPFHVLLIKNNTLLLQKFGLFF